MKPIERLTELFLTTQRAISTTVNAKLKQRGVSTAQYECLGHLAAAGGSTMTGVAEMMGHTTAAATGLIDRLSALEFVERAAKAGDRRSITVTLTPKGAAFLDEMRSLVQELLEVGLAGRVSIEFVTQFESIVERLRLTS